MRHPAGFETKDFEIYRPNDVQIQSTAWRVPDRDHYRRRYQVNPYLALVLIIGSLICLVWLVMEMW